MFFFFFLSFFLHSLIRSCYLISLRIASTIIVSYSLNHIFPPHTPFPFGGIGLTTVHTSDVCPDVFHSREHHSVRRAAAARRHVAAARRAWRGEDQHSNTPGLHTHTRVVSRHPPATSSLGRGSCSSGRVGNQKAQY